MDLSDSIDTSNWRMQVKFFECDILSEFQKEINEWFFSFDFSVIVHEIFFEKSEYKDGYFVAIFYEIPMEETKKDN